MAVETERGVLGASASTQRTGAQGERRSRSLTPRRARLVLARGFRFLGRYRFSSLTRRIVTLNVMALAALVAGVLYLNQFREGLIDARAASLLTQGEIMAAAIAASATVETGGITLDTDQLLELETGESLAFDLGADSLQFPIDPERVGPVLRRLVSPTQTRARIYDPEGLLVIDTEQFYQRGEILRFDLPPLNADPPPWWEQMAAQLKSLSIRPNLPLYQDLGAESGLGYAEVATALQGSSASVVRVTETGELIVSVAVPVQRFRFVLGALLLSTEAGDIDAVLQAERFGIVRVFLVAATVTVALSILLAGTIAGPMRRLADGADRVRRSVKAREQIPDFSDRSDEIGHLSKALRDMTDSLYARMEAIESFAADVAHELKNPLTSLRSAVETFPLARTDADRVRLVEIIQHDVRRLDRLISDISDASRLDAELARGEAKPVDLRRLLDTVVGLANEVSKPDTAPIVPIMPPRATGAMIVSGDDGRLGQVIHNLIDNARSFSPADRPIEIRATVEAGGRGQPRRATITVDDCGPGIPPENLERVFERFYTDRPDGEAFGQNSGLGLSISRQIIEAHSGTLHAENRPGADGTRAGARFVIRLPLEGAA